MHSISQAGLLINFGTFAELQLLVLQTPLLQWLFSLFCQAGLFEVLFLYCCWWTPAC